VFHLPIIRNLVICHPILHLGARRGMLDLLIGERTAENIKLDIGSAFPSEKEEKNEKQIDKVSRGGGCSIPIAAGSL